MNNNSMESEKKNGECKYIHIERFIIVSLAFFVARKKKKKNYYNSDVEEYPWILYYTCRTLHTQLHT